MGSPSDIHAMAERIERMKQAAEDLKVARDYILANGRLETRNPKLET